MEKQRKKIWQENFLTKFLKLLLQWNNFVVETLLDEEKPFILNWKVIYDLNWWIWDKILEINLFELFEYSLWILF